MKTQDVKLYAAQRLHRQRRWQSWLWRALRIKSSIGMP